MIFLDANIFVRLLVSPKSSRDEEQLAAVARFLRSTRTGTQTFTTSEAVIAEVTYVMTSPNIYKLERAYVAPRLRLVLSLKGCRLPARQVVLRAIDIWESTPALSFVDALTAAHLEGSQDELWTFDRRLRKHPGIRFYEPA